MPKQVLKELEREKGDLELVIPPLVNKIGVVKAGRDLKMSGATVGKWLDDHGYVKRTEWVKVTPQEESA